MITHSVRQVKEKAVLFCKDTPVSFSKYHDMNFWIQECPECGMLVRTYGVLPDKEIEEYYPKGYKPCQPSLNEN